MPSDRHEPQCKVRQTTGVISPLHSSALRGALECKGLWLLKNTLRKKSFPVLWMLPWRGFFFAESFNQDGRGAGSILVLGWARGQPTNTADHITVAFSFPGSRSKRF